MPLYRAKRKKQSNILQRITTVKEERGLAFLTRSGGLARPCSISSEEDRFPGIFDRAVYVLQPSERRELRGER